MSILDCDPPEADEPSDKDSGGVSVPDVTVLERERLARPGREKTRVFTAEIVSTGQGTHRATYTKRAILRLAPSAQIPPD